MPDLVIAVSSLVKDLIPNKSIVLHPRPPELDALLRIPIGDKMPWVFYSGTFIPIKGVQKIPEIAKEVIKEVGGEVRFILIGGSSRDPLGSYVTRKAHEYGIENHINIISHIPRGELLRLKRKCLIYIQPSLFDAFPIAVIEAMALGSIPIVTKYVGSKDIIAHVDADLITDLSPSSIAKVIIRLLNNDILLRDLSRSVREAVSKYLSSTNLTREVSSLINQCLS
jgi:glycosyltransferase involved in cell wall biosynthesis